MYLFITFLPVIMAPFFNLFVVLLLNYFDLLID
jgi:hypothetical protein